MDKHILCLSWLNGQIKAVAVRNGSVLKTWERPGVVDDFSTFSNILKEAVAATDYDGYIGQGFSPRNSADWAKSLEAAYRVCEG